MSSNPQESSDQSLADTRIEYKHQPHAPGSAPVTEGRGCLLQIYPVPATPALSRLSVARSVVGRETTSHVTVDDSSVSRMHASIEWTNGCYHITDLNSTNGSWVNDVQVTAQTELQGGEILRLGNTILKFMLAVDEEAQYHAIVHDLMTRDSLTGAFNRGYLFPHLHQTLEAAQKSQSPLSLIIIDVDRFKRVNDRFGHLIGDEVLRIFCERIRPILDEAHFLCRFGGEEFVVVCPDTSLDMTVQFAELIRQEIAGSPFATQSGNLKMTCSLGVSSTEDASITTVDELINTADRLLYSAKGQGRNCVHRPDGRPARRPARQRRTSR